MIDLIHSEFSRLLKSKLFRAAWILTSAWIILNMFMYELPNYLSSLDQDYIISQYTLSYNAPYMSYTFIFFGFISAIVISFFIGKEFSSGTIQNKVISGHSRVSIYSAYLIVCFLGEIVIQLTCVITTVLSTLLQIAIIYATSKNVLILHQWEDIVTDFQNFVPDPDTTYFFLDVTLQSIVKNQLIGFCILAVYAAFFTLIAMLMQSSVRTVIVSIIAAIAILIWGETIYSGLMFTSLEPFMEATSPEEYEEIKESLRGENLSGTKKTLYLFLDDFIPYNQSLALTQDIVPRRGGKYVIYDCGLTAASTAFGILIFRKKDLKSGVKSE